MTERTSKRTALPRNLGATQRRLYKDLAPQLEGDEARLALLKEALGAHKLAEDCQAQIDRDGLVLKNGKPHPLLTCLRDARKAFGVLMKQLKLDDEPKRRPGRPSRPIGISHTDLDWRNQ